MSANSAKSSPAAPLPFKITDATQLEDWKKWQRSFRCYANSINLEQECHDVQLCVFKSLVGPDALEIYNTFSLLDITDVESVIRKFDEHFKPKVNVTMERYKLYKLNQKIGQPFDDYLSDITNQVEKCEFTAMRDEIVLYKIVGGIDSDEIRNVLLADADLKYDKAVQICRASSAMHFMSGKENCCKGATEKKKEPGKTPKISFKEQRRSQLESTKNLQVADTESKLKTTSKAELKLNDTSKVIEKESSVEQLKNESGPKRLRVKKAKRLDTLIDDGLKDDSLMEQSESENVDDSQKTDEASDGGDSDWRADDDPDDYYDYDPDHHSLKKSGKMKERQKNTKVATPKKKRVPAKKASKVLNLPCDICGKTLKTELALERHRSVHVHGQHAICYYCGKQCSKYFLRRHMTGSHYEIIGCPPPKFYSCDKCEFKTRFGENLQRHKYQHTGEKPLACDLCEYRCIRPCLLKAHVAKQHTGERPFSCSVCKRGFLHSDALRRHMVIHMSPEEKAKRLERLNSTCDVCGKAYSSKAALRIHSLLHTGEKPYACDKCGFRTVTRGNLTSHLMVHSEEKPWVCSVCGYSCRQKSVLGQHMNTHTGEKPYSCELCGRKFSQSHHVKTHMLTHTGVKPHVCEVCGHGFTTRGSLKAHMKVHEKHSGDASQYMPPRKRLKKPAVVPAPPSDESGRSEDDRAAANAVITWSEQVSAINPVEYTPSLETPPPFHATYPVPQGNPRPPDCRYYQHRQWQNQNYRQDQDPGQ